MNIKNILTILLTAIFIVSVSAFPQETTKSKPDETNAEIPALDNFHEVIYKIWHTAWPEKDVNMLVELLPEVQKLSESLIKAELPGILRDKKPAWKENIAKFQTIVAHYKKYSSPVDSQQLLATAEQLHSQYEKLVRVVRPALKEIDDFHTTLYMLYHYYMPESNKEKIASSVKELKAKMEVLDKTTLPERMKKREQAFTEAKAKLSRSVETLNISVGKGEMKMIKTNIEAMHTDYQALEKVFE